MAVFPTLRTLDELLDLARARGSRPALVTAEDGGLGISYGELAALCERLGRHLRVECGLRAGEVVSIVLPRRTSLAQVVGTLAAMAARLVAAPLNPSYKVEELEFFLSDAEAKIVLVEAANESGRSAWLAATTLNIPTCAMTLEWGADGPALTLSAMGAGGSTRSRSRSEEDASAEEAERPRAEDVALVLHTSGTTSRPKLVPLTHRNMCASVRAVVRHYAISEADATLIVQPLFHIGGLVTPLLSTLSVGGRVAIASMFDDARHWQFVVEHGVTWFTAVPTIHKVLLANAERDFEPLASKPSLRFIRSGSAALPPDLLDKIEAAFGAPLIESYGMTEAAQLICANPLPPGARYAGSVGVCAGPEGRVFDAETGRRAALDEDGAATGEMCIAGESVMLGYARNPSANAGSFVADPDEGGEPRWFRTGDLVTRTAEGYYSIVGRIKEIINRAGEKIAPAKLDKVLAYEGRKDSVVCFGAPDPDFGQSVAAALVFDPDKFPDDRATPLECKRRAELLIKTALAKLAPHEVPTTVFALGKDDVPKTATGKTKRLKCGDLCLETLTPIVKNGVWRAVDAVLEPAEAAPEPGKRRQEAAAAASTWSLDDARAKARGAIAEALTAVGVPLAVADDSPLMQSGLTSMMVFGFVRALSASLALEATLPHMLVFDAPTPAALSAELAERMVGAPALVYEDTAASSSSNNNNKASVKTAVAAASWRLPGVAAGGDPDAARGVLDGCVDVKTAVPATRWSPEALGLALGKVAAEGVVARCQFGGFLEGLDEFDNARFGISRGEAALVDPQQRLLMEHGYAALVSNEGPLSAASKPHYDVGVFVGVSFHDWALLTLWNGEPAMRKSAMASSGSFTSVASGRLSFALGLRGPCVTLNTACSSGLVALHDAHAAVAARDAPDGALAAATNVILEPTISINFAVKGITSPRGRCHTFDASADGYLRSEACVCVRLDAAGRAAGAADVERVVVRHDGRSASLTAPNGSAQLAMLLAARASIQGADPRAAIEAHGTATPLGDPIEVGALARLAATSPSNSPHRFAVSGAKSSFGHTEAVAGATGLLALLLATRAETAAPNGALCVVNPAVRDAFLAAKLNLGATESTPLAAPRAGVSSLGASGTIAHALLAATRDPETAAVLAKPWPVFKTRLKFPWKPYEPAGAPPPPPPPRGGGEERSSVLETVRAVAAPFLEGEVGDDESLLDSGLDSIVAVELVAELQAKFEGLGLEIPQTLLTDCPSIAEIAAFLGTADAPATSPAADDEFPNTEGDDGPTIVVKKKVAPSAPLEGAEQIFFIHGVDGDPLAMLFQQVAAELRFPSSTVRCVEAPKASCATLEELAAYYAARVKERQPGGKYRIFGHSFGALIAHQVALQLERGGDEVAALVLGDFEVTYPPSRSRAAAAAADKGRFGLEEWEGGEIESIKLACRRFGSSAAGGGAFDPDEFRDKVLAGARSPEERRMRAMFHYMPAYMQRREWDRLLDLWERNMEYLHTVTVPKFGPRRRRTFEPDAVLRGPTLHLRALGSHEFAAAVEINRKYCANYQVQALQGLHYTFLQKPNAAGVAKAIDDFVSGDAAAAAPSSAEEEEEKKKTTPAPLLHTPALAARTLPAVVAAHARRRASAPCLVSWDRKMGEVETVSYGELAARAAATADRLAAEGLRPGDALALLSHATVAAHVLVLGAMTAGLRSVMLNPRLPADVLAALCASARVSAIASGLALREIASHFAPGVGRTLLILGSDDERPPDADGLLDTTRDPAAPTSAAIARLERCLEADAPCVVMFTSGTTGTPKPIVRTHKHILVAVDRMRNFEVDQQRLYGGGGGSGDESAVATLSFLPLYHMMGLTHNLALNLRLGARVLVHADAPYMPLTLGLLLEAAPALKPTSIESIAVVAEQLSEMLAVGGDMARDIAKRLATVSCLKVGGSPLARRVVRNLEALLGVRVVTHFGQTELCGYVLAAATPPDGAARDAPAALPRKPSLDNLMTRSSSASDGLHRISSASDFYGNDEDPNYLVEEKRLEAVQNLCAEDAEMRPVDRSMRIELRGTSFATNGLAVHTRNGARHEVGELIITKGLWGPTDATPHATGDIFVVNADSGSFTFKARLDGMIVLGSGEMLDPLVVETQLLRALAKYLKRCCLVGNGRPRPALLLELRHSARDHHTGRPADSVLDDIAAAVKRIETTDTATAILPTHVIILPDNDTLPTTLKGAVDANASIAHFSSLLNAADRGSLVPISLQAYKLHHLDDKE